jgi:plastocyanin
MKTNFPFVFAFILAGCSGDYGPPSNTDNNPSAGGNQGAQSATVATRSEDDGYGYGTMTHSFAPGSVTVRRGGSVTWTNETSFEHNVTFKVATGAPANVDALSAGSATRTFGTAGTFAYACANHAGMNGVIVVQ